MYVFKCRSVPQQKNVMFIANDEPDVILITEMIPKAQINPIRIIRC